MASPSFWERSQEEISKISKTLSLNKEKIEQWEHLNKELEDLALLTEIAVEEEDSSALQEISKDLKALEKQVEEMEIQALFTDPDDSRNAIVSINAGAGGTDAQDWVQMLLRMFLRWCEDKGMETKIIDILPGEEAGLKSVTFTVTGPYAYGRLKAEHGIHRLVRISPFDANFLKHNLHISKSLKYALDLPHKGHLLYSLTLNFFGFKCRKTQLFFANFSSFYFLKGIPKNSNNFFASSSVLAVVTILIPTPFTLSILS